VYAQGDQSIAGSKDNKQEVFGGGGEIKDAERNINPQENGKNIQC